MVISAVLWGAASRNGSKQYAESLCGSHLAFSSDVSLDSRWCNHIVVLTQPLV